MTEAFLQYVWQHKLLEGPLVTTDGLPVVVERPGEMNRDAGPDFFDARLVIGGVLWAGNVEVHVRASDWRQHHHSDDKSYNNVILHVVYIHDADITLQNGKSVPTLTIADAIPEKIWENYDALMHPDGDVEIPCASRLKEIPDFLFRISQDRMTVERIERKSGDVKRLLKESKGSWEQTCYWLTARAFGAKTNAMPFELLAKKTPMSLLAKIKDNPFRLESLFFGQAGMLDGEFSDDYPKAMQREYNYLCAAHNLVPMAGHLWKFFRMRPAGFPTLRISQFSRLIAQSSNLFSKLLDTKDVSDLRRFFDVSTSEYWNNHYRFDEINDSRPKSLGLSQVDVILINAWIPLLFEYGVMHDDQSRKDQAFDLLQQLPAEKNQIVKRWEKAGIVAKNASETQALIQRYNEYCQKQKCLDCQIAFRLINGERRIEN